MSNASSNQVKYYMSHMPKIFAMGFKILRSTSVQSTRCWRTEAIDQGKNGSGLWPIWCKFSKPLAYLWGGVYAECTLGC